MSGWPAFVILGLLGMAFGSYATMLTYRWPRQLLKLDDTDKPQRRSFCPTCRKNISPAMLVPIFSFVFNKGKSACCNEPIPIRYPLIETLMMVFFLGVGLLASRPEEYAYWLPIAFVTGVVIVIDWEHMIVPDLLSGFLIIWPIIFSVAFGVPQDWQILLISGLLGFGMLWFAFFLTKLFTGKEAMGSADPILFGFIAMHFEPVMIPWLLLSMSAFGFLLFLLNKKSSSEAFPLGPAIMAGGIICLILGRI